LFSGHKIAYMQFCSAGYPSLSIPYSENISHFLASISSKEQQQ
jgi:hypothetical protein